MIGFPEPIELLKKFDFDNGYFCHSIEVKVRYCREYKVVEEILHIVATISKVEIRNGARVEQLQSLVDIKDVAEQYFPDFMKEIKYHECWDELAANYEPENI